MNDPYVQYMYSYPHKLAYEKLCGIDLRQEANALLRGENSLYFHIPFCQYKCGYCNLFSLAGQSGRQMEEYVKAMQRHAMQIAEILPQDAAFSDLTLGGGTPLILPEKLLQEVFSIAENYFGMEAGKQTIVVETSPNQTTEEKLRILKEVGVTRISIGVQSFQESELCSLHRFHTKESAKKALDLIGNVGFDCLNIDLIYGIPGQTKESLKDSLCQALAFKPEELFVYPLYIKSGTQLFYQGEERSKDTFEMYQFVRQFLKEAGYQPYSMRRFVKQKSGQALWEAPVSLCGFGNTISVGCGGRSYLGNLHFCMPYAVEPKQCRTILQNYIEQKDDLKITHGFLLSKEEEKRRYVIKHVLFGRGICLKEYNMYFGSEVVKDFPLLLDWVKHGYALIEEFLSLTEQGFALSDYLGPRLISDQVRHLMDSQSCQNRAEDQWLEGSR